MERTATTYAILSQASLLLGALLCVAAQPRYVLGHNEGGFSNYATDRRTRIPYGLAFVGDVVFVLLMNVQLHRAASLPGPVIAMLDALAALLTLVLLTSFIYKRNEPLRRLHFLCGIVLIGFETILGPVLLAQAPHEVLSWLALAAQLAGDLLCLLSLRRTVERLFLGQVLASTGFGILLIRAVLLGAR